MPNFNGEKFVRQAIDSVLNQTYKNFELIVVDDKSTDTSPMIIENIAKIDSRVKLIKSEKNNGVAITRNIGIKEASGQYIALLDNDDVWEEDKLERQLNLALDGYDIVYCSYDFIDENDKKIKKPFIVPKTTDFKKMLSSSVISSSTCFIKTELIQANMFTTEYYHEDYVLWMRLLSLPNTKAVGDEKVLMHYRIVSGSRSDSKCNSAKQRWIIYRKALKMNIFASLWAFLCYTFKSVIKYYF